MKTFSYTIQDKLGIHARPAGLIVKEAQKYDATITIEANGKGADAGKIIAVMALGAKQGTEVTVKAEGVDEATAIEEIKKIFEANL